MAVVCAAMGRNFLNVKPLSQYVTSRLRSLPTRIVLKGAADAGGKAVTLAITVLAARTLVSDAFGALAIAMVTGWLLGVATDAGLSMYLARETARQRGRLRGLLSEVMILRVGLAYTAVMLVALLAGRVVPPHWKLQFVLVVVAQLTSAVLETVAHFFRGLERSEIESTIHLLQRGVTLLLCVTVLWFWPRLDLLGAAMLAPAVVALIAAVVIAFTIAGASGTAGASGALGALGASSASSASGAQLSVRRFINEALPLGVGALLSAIYFRCDVYFIERWHGLEAAGGYNAVFRLVEAMRLLPAAVMAVTFPLLVTAPDARLVHRIGRDLALAGVALAAISALGSPFIVVGIYGAPYGYTAPAFSILAVALPFFFLNYALTHQVIGWGRQRSYLAISSIALAANIAANLALIPTRGIVGAAIATIVTELVVTAGCVYVLWSPLGTTTLRWSSLR